MLLSPRSTQPSSPFCGAAAIPELTTVALVAEQKGKKPRGRREKEGSSPRHSCRSHHVAPRRETSSRREERNASERENEHERKETAALITARGSTAVVGANRSHRRLCKLFPSCFGSGPAATRQCSYSFLTSVQPSPELAVAGETLLELLISAGAVSVAAVSISMSFNTKTQWLAITCSRLRLDTLLILRCKGDRAHINFREWYPH